MRNTKALLITLAVLTAPVSCTPLVGAMMDKVEDATGDREIDYVDIPGDHRISCTVHDDCPPGHFCSRPGCTTAGECRPIPRSCDETYDPVCSCEDNDFDNACLMERALESKQYEGSCSKDTCTWDGSQSCPEGYLCDGECGQQDGFCVPDTVCDMETPESAPVCGCIRPDRLNFVLFEEGDCERLWAGAWLAPRDKCSGIMPCTPDSEGSDCEGGEFCEGETGVCDTFIEGWCEPMPQDSCTEDYVPVCGCDNISYLNNCYRKAEAVRRKYDYLCDCGTGLYGPEDGGEDNAGCVSPQFCESSAGCANDIAIEGEEDEPMFGYCVDPRYCEDGMYETGPVCGCDDKTYENDCERRQAMTSWRHDGPCMTDL